MQIAIDASSTFPPRTGVGNYTYNLIKALAEVDKENEYILYFNWLRWSKVKPDFKYPNFRDAINRIPAKAQRILHNNFRLPIEFFIGKVDVFHSPNYFLPPVRSVRTVVTINDLTFKRFPETQTKSNAKYFNTWVPRSAEVADRIIAISENTRREIVELLNIPAEKIEVIYLAASKNFSLIEDKKLLESVRKKYKLPQQFLFYTGTLEPRKNISTLIRVFTELKKNYSLSHKLVITGGKGWLYEDIFAKVRALGLENEIIFTGYLPEEDLRALYNLADVFVFPSLYEGFGLPPLEAMACGTPVICSNTSSLPEVVGDAGILVDPMDVDGWVKAIYSVLSDENLAQELRRKGLERVKLFSWDKTARETLSVYKSVIG